jgi:hypothetical protein
MWNALRVPIAFLVAPLMVPLTITAFIAIDHSQILVAQGHTIEGIRLFALGSGIFAYAGTIILGIPTYVLLRKRNMTAFWVAPVAGFIAGAMQMLVIFNFSALPALVGGPLGAVVGTAIWLNARPDRQSH